MLRIKTGVAGCLAVLAIAGCSSGHKNDGGQVLAIVDGAELTAPMLDTALSSLPPDSDPASPVVQKATLERLVSEMLLAKQAQDMKLDKLPATVRAIEAERRRILADAYLRNAVGDTRPSDVEVVGFFGDHPYLCNDRRRYALNVIQLRGGPEDVKPYVAAFARPGMTVDGLVAEMHQHGVEAVASRSTLDADQLPDTVARNLVSASPGTNLTYRQGAVQNFIQITGIEQSPVPLALARPSIARYLEQKRQAAAAEANLKRLRAQAGVKFVGTGRAIVNHPGATATQTAARRT